MSGGLREWGLTVCTASVFCAAINMLVPDEKYERVINICLSALMILVIASPLANIESCDFSFDIPQGELTGQHEIEELINTQSARAVAKAAEGAIEQRLISNGINTKRICVSTDIADNGCISIRRVEVELDPCSTVSAAEVRLLLREWAGLEEVDVMQP